ncbi:MAG: MFS transporter [Pseudomonadota bacterium]
MSVVSGAFVYARGVFLPEMADEFGGSRFNITLAFSIAQAVGALAAPAIGIALDRWHPRYVLLGGAVMVTAGYFLTAQAQSYLSLYLIFGLLFGAGWRGISSFATSRVLVRWFFKRRGLALSIDVAGASVAGIIVPFVAVWMMGAYGWRPGFAVFGVFTLALVIPLVAFVIKAEPADVGDVMDGPENAAGVTPAGAEGAAGHWSSRALLRTPTFYYIVLIFSAMLCVWNGVLMHLFGHLEARSFADQQAAAVLSVMGLLIAGGKPILGYIADRFSTKTAVALSLAGQTIGVGIYWLSDSYVFFLLGAVIYGFGLSGMTPLLSMAVATVFGAQSYGRANGLLQPFMLPVALAASPIAAWIFDQTGDYTAAFGLFFAIMIVAIPVLLWTSLRPAVPPA